MRPDELHIRDWAHDILEEWLGGSYAAAPVDHTDTSPGDWHMKVVDDPRPGAIYQEMSTGRRYRIEMRVTRL